MLAGDRDTGVTIMRVVKELDAGPILAQAEVPIGPDDTAVARRTRGRESRRRAADRDRRSHGRGSGDRDRRRTTSLATYAPKLTKADGLIDWSRTADRLHNQIRGLTPWPHAYTFLDDTRFILHGSHVGALPPEAAAPGTIVAASAHEGLLVACGERTVLEILALQLEGKRVMSARDALATPLLKAGARFAKA